MDAPTKNSCTNAENLVHDLSQAAQQTFIDAENKVRRITETLTELSSRLQRVTDGIRNRTGFITVNSTPHGYQASRTLRTVRRVTERGRDQNQSQQQTNARRQQQDNESMNCYDKRYVQICVIFLHS